MLTRSFDVNAINAAANRPDVRPFIGPASLGELDFEDAVTDYNNWFLMGEHGGFVLVWSAPGVYEVHVFIATEGRGKWAAQAWIAAREYAAQNGAKMLWARIAPAAKFVSMFARRGGMKPTYEMLYTLGSAYDVYKMEL
jgi:hypothetical protein